MSDNAWDFDLDDEDNSGRNPLRDPLKAAQKRIKDLEKANAEAAAENVSLKQGARTRTVEEILTTKGVRKSIAKYIPAEAADEDAINAWLVENAEDFGITLDDADETPSGISAEDQAAARQIGSATSGGAAPAPNKIADLIRRMEANTDPNVHAQLKAEMAAFTN